MELILWRHADAEDGAPDLERRLTPKGRKDAERVAKWLLRHLPAGFEVVASPAARAQETAKALKVRIRIDPALAPGASVNDILGAAARAAKVAVIVGHQPDLGCAIAHLFGHEQAEWRLRKGALWWIEDDLVKAVISPDLL
jgi:phosphohistidine phosphatase